MKIKPINFELLERMFCKHDGKKVRYRVHDGRDRLRCVKCGYLVEVKCQGGFKDA